MGRTRLIPLFITAIALTAGGGCSDSAQNLNDAADALTKHYAAHPLEREWAVRTIEVDEGENRLIAHIEVLSETDIARLRAMSRMEQFTAAKLACPTITPALTKALGETRVWVSLSAENRPLTSSICPQ